MKPSLSLIMVLALAFSSCTSDPSGLGKKVELPLKGNRVIHLAIQSPRTVTLRAEEQDKDPMEEISSLRFVFYGGASKDKVSHIRELTVLPSTTLSDIPLTLPAEDYRLVVIANATPSLKASTQVGSPLSMLENFTPHRASDFTTDHPLRLAMLNSQGAVEVSRTAFSSPTPSVTITLESTLARVLVYGDPTLAGGATKGNLPPSYIITAQAKSIAALRPLALLPNGAMEVPGDGSSPEDRYPKGEYYDTWLSTPPTKTAGLLSYFDPLSVAINTIEWCTMPTSEPTSNSWKQARGIYAKESTIPPTAYLTGTVPTVYLRYPYIPSGLTLTAKEGWLSFQGQYYTETQVKQMLQTERYPNEELKEALTRAGITSASFTKPFDKEGLAFYYMGISYYTIPIRHFDNTKAPLKNSIGRYGLVRGNEYRIHITNIQRAGSPLPAKLEDNLTPLSEEKAHHSALTLAPVITRRSDTELY